MSSVIANLRVMLSADSAQLRTQLGRANKDTKQWAKRQEAAVGRVAHSFLALGATIGSSLAFGDAIRRADEMILIRARLDALTGSAKGTAIAMNAITRMANQSRAPIKAAGELYTKMAIATDHLELSQRKVAEVSQVVLDTFLLSGASASEAANSARQFAQGLASGRLQGDELRSVLENNVVLSKLLADGLGVTVGQLRILGEQGELTADKLVGLLGKAFKETRADVDNMRLTFGQATTIMSNEFTKFVDKVERNTNFIDILVTGTRWISQNMENLAYTAGTLATAGMGALLIALAKVVWAMSPIGKVLTLFVTGMSIASFYVSKYSAEIAEAFFRTFNIFIPRMYNNAMLGGMNFQRSVMQTWNSVVSTMATKLNELNVLGSSLPNWLKSLLGWEDGQGITLGGAKLQLGAIDAEIATVKKKLEALANLESDYQTMLAEIYNDSISTVTDGDTLDKTDSFLEKLDKMWAATTQSISNTFNTLALSYDTSWLAILEASSSGSKKLTAIYKGMAIANIIVDTARAIMAVYADSSIGSIWAKHAMAAKMGIIGAANLQTVRGQFHDGIDNVPSSGTYMLEKGERVVDSRLNKDLTKALSGGSVGGQGYSLNFNVNGVEDPEVINKIIAANRGKFESMIREIHADRLSTQPF
jgi:tape measure domain-containing protein